MYIMVRLPFCFLCERLIYSQTSFKSFVLLLFSVGDSAVNRFVTNTPLSNFFSDLVTHFKKQCFDLHGWVTEASK